MATIRDYFATDFKNDLRLTGTLTVSAENGSFQIVVEPSLQFDFESGAKYVSIFVPKTPQLFDVCNHLLSDLEPVFTLANGVQVSSGAVGEKMVPATSLSFTGRVYLYLE